MSNFLINLARRGAGLPAGQINARPSVREYQASSENLEHDQIVETSEQAAFEPESQPTFETTPAARAQTSQVSQAQAPQARRVPQAVLTAGPARLIQRSKEANNQTANPRAVTRPESPAPSTVDQNYARQASTTSPKVSRQFHPPVNERPPASTATAQPLTENVVVAKPRASANEESPATDSHGSREPSRTILSEADKALQIVPLAETHEYAPKGERQSEPERDRAQLGVVTLTPRLPAIESQRLTRLSNVASAASADVASIPIHVRIAKVEVRAAPATMPAAAPRVGPAPIGFGSYYRLRNYRS